MEFIITRVLILQLFLKVVIGKPQVKVNFGVAPGYIGFRSADHLHRVDLEPKINTMTLFIPGPFGLRKNKRANYKTNFKGEKENG